MLTVFLYLFYWYRILNEWYIIFNIMYVEYLYVVFFEPKYLRSLVAVALILYLSFRTLFIMVCLNIYFTKF